MLISPFILTASYALHLIATVVWIGGLITLALIVQPIAARRLPDQAALAQLLDTIQRRFQPLANISLITLILTGMVQMAASKFYIGFLRFDNVWSQAILLKHIAVIVMIGLAGIMTFSIQPALRRNALLAANDISDEAEQDRLRKQQVRLTRLNVVFSVLVLIFTAIARAQ
jgi:uncharacterized membrane protein